MNTTNNTNNQNTTIRPFINDAEKLLDMKELTKTQFLASYSYLTEEEYDKTEECVRSLGGFGSYKFYEKIFNILANNGLVFRMAISELMAKGINFYEEMSYDDLRDNAAGNGLMTREFVIELFTTAKHLSRCNHIDLLNYISKNIDYCTEGDDSPSYQRLVEIAEDAIEDDTYNRFEYNSTEAGLDKLRYDIHLDDDEIKFFGYEWALEEAGEGEED